MKMHVCRLDNILTRLLLTVHYTIIRIPLLLFSFLRTMRSKTLFVKQTRIYF